MLNLHVLSLSTEFFHQRKTNLALFSCLWATSSLSLKPLLERHTSKDRMSSAVLWDQLTHSCWMALTAFMARERFRQARMTRAPCRANDLAVSKPGKRQDRHTYRQKKKECKPEMLQRFFSTEIKLRFSGVESNRALGGLAAVVVQVEIPINFPFNFFHWVTQWSRSGS